jgi:myosin protein heavy chain
LSGKLEPGTYKFLDGETSISGRDGKSQWSSLVVGLQSHSQRGAVLIARLVDQDALATIGFTGEMQRTIFGLLAAILHLSNLPLASSTNNSQAYLTDSAALESASRLLGLSSSALREGLLNPTTKAGTESFRQSRSKEQVVAEVAALSRAVYEHCFGRIVEGINEVLAPNDVELAGDERFIGVLDIAGFEVVEKNGFEQLCKSRSSSL